MSKMTKKQPKAGKIPRGLTDKDMFRDYVEEETLEEKLVAAEKKAEKQRKGSELFFHGRSSFSFDRIGHFILCDPIIIHSRIFFCDFLTECKNAGGSIRNKKRKRQSGQSAAPTRRKKEERKTAPLKGYYLGLMAL